MDQKEFDAILKSHKHAEESPGDIADRIIGMGQPKRTIGGTLKDIGVTSVNAAIGAGEAVVGLADLATGGMAGKGLSQLGYDPKAARNFLQQYKSEAQQAADRRVDEAKGFGGTLKAYLRNPSTIVEAGAESLPSMFLGGGIGRGIGAAGKAAGILSNPAARAGLLGAIGEGVVGAGSAAEQIRQETGEITGKGAASAIGSGVGTGVLGRLGNKLAPKLGAVDIEEALVRGFSGNARNVPLSFGKTLKAITGGAISEGAFEELPQSIQEQVWQNYATGKPLMEGVPEGAAQGLVTGAAMGGAVNIHSALPGQQRKALAELEQKRQARLAQEHDKLVREATRGQVTPQATTGQNLPGVSSAGLNFDGGSGLPPGVAPYMAGQNASTFDLMREQQQRQAQTALDLEQRQQAAREQVLQQERIQNQLAANGFGYAPGQRAAVHGAPDEMASALAGETEEEYQQRLGNLEQRRQQGQQGLINVLQNRVDMQRQNAQATAGAIAKAAQAAKQQEDEQAQRDRFDQWAAAERAAGRDVGPFSMDEQQQAKAASSGPLGKSVAKGFGALNEAERAVEYGRIFDRGATNTQAIEQIQAERERAFFGDGESSDAGLPEFRQELAANRRERVAQGLPATLTPDAKAAATIEGVDFRQQPGSKLPPELDYQVSRMEAQLQESITGTHEANVDQNGDAVWLKGKGYWPQWMEKKTMPRGKWAKQGTQEREDQAETLKNANILHDAGRDKILAVIDKARKGVALGSHEKSIWSAVERIASQPGGPALWGQSDMLIADANEAAANERMQARYGLSMLPKPMTVRVADIEPGETLAVDGMVEDAVGKTVLYTHKGIDAQGNTIMERGEHDAVTGKTGAARVMRFEPTDHLEGVIGVRERADREQSPNRTTKAYNREGKAFRSIEKQGIAITEPQNIPVDMLRPGDRVVIRDPQGMPDVATMRGYDSNNRAVIRDGIEYHLQADDNITVEGFRAKGEVRQTKGFGYRPKNERQQIAREYEQDRQERAERSGILREAKTQVRGELTNTLRQIAGKRRIHAEEQRALATQANRRQQAGADSKQGTPQAVMPKGSRPTASLGYGFHPGDNTPTLERARAQKQEQKENRKTFPGTQYETGEQRVRENRRNFPATKYETGKPGRIEREAFARPTGYQQVKPATDVERENKRQSGLARQQEGEARPQGTIRGGTDNDHALAHEQYQAVLDFAAGKLRRENAGLSTREARRQAVQQLGLEEKAVPETGWWRERAGKSPGYLANLLRKSAAKRTKTAEAIQAEHSSGSNPYFLSTEKSTIVPLKDLLSSEPKLDAARVDRARANMDAAAAGTGAKRKPLPVYRRSDGKLVALDGNSTLAVLRERGEKSAIVEIKKTIKQPRATLDEIYADAAKADKVLRKSLADFVERTGGRLVSRPDDQIKSRERAEQKARQDSTPRKLKDIVAHTLVYPDQKALMQALPQLEKEYGPIELKNRFENPPDSGYRDILANVRVKEANGHIAEIQLTTEAMLQAKEGLGHKIYEVQRELDDIAKRTSNAEATELALEFDKISKEYYEAAAQSSSSSKSATASSSALFRLTLSPDLNKTLARASELLVSMNSSPNIRKSVLDLESSLKGVPSQSKYRSSMESSPVAEEKSSGSGENIQQKAAQSEENQASLDDVLKQLYGQIMKSGESRNARTPWTEKTSKAIIMGPHGSARKSNESLYRAAKEGGDPKAAYELVAPLVTKEGVDAIRAKLRDVTSAVVVPVVSEERLGRNKIPRAYADILADRLGAQVAVDIVHINKVSRGGSDGFHRLAAQPEFDGAVEAGREYIIVDDTLAQGGTLASLKGYIEQKGGRVVAISALTGKDYSAKLRPNTGDLELLRKKYPELEAFWYEEFGYGFDRLTSSEANYLCTVKGHTFDTIRDRILAERRQGGASNHSGSDSTGQSGGPVSGSLDSKSHFPSFKSAGKGDGANPSSDSGHSSSRTRFQQVREQINRILPNKDEARAIIAIIEARAFSAGLTPEEFVAKRGLTFVDAELPVNPQGKLLEKMMGGQLRGAFNVRDYVEEGRAIITAFRGNANVSTLAHELGHLFRQDLKRYGQDRLLAMAEHWAGVKNGRWNREQEEKFARGFEAYLLEGKAPTTAMGKVFERFRVWISRLYGALVGSQLNVGLDDEIRSVFDALLTEHAAEDAGDAFAEGIAKTRARIAELEGSGPIDLDHRTLFQIGLADSGGAGNTFTGWAGAINRIMASHPKWRDRWERFIYNMVDTNDPRERIWKAAGSPDAQDIVTVERLRGKKAAAEQKAFRDGMVTPLLKSMAAAGLKASDLEEYAHAMHAPERNQRMREVNAKRTLDSLLEAMTDRERREYDEQISGLRNILAKARKARAQNKKGITDTNRIPGIEGWETRDIQNLYLQVMEKIFSEISTRVALYNKAEAEFAKREWTDIEKKKGTHGRYRKRLDNMKRRLDRSRGIMDRWREESVRFAGITDGEAQSIVAKWRQDKRFAAIEDARQQLSAISRATLDTLHEAGELGDEEYQALRNGYQYYVPLHRDGFQDTRPATGRVTGPTGRPFKVAKGSMLEVVNILPEVIRAHETAINRKHKLEAGRALYEFALAHPDAGITVEKQEQMPTHDREGNIVMYTKQTEPEDGVFVKVDGKRYLLRFAADVRTPEGRTLTRFLDSIKGQDAQLGGITKSLHKITRLLAAVNTSLSPEFVVSNFSRDLQTALIHLNQEDINMKGLQSQVLKSVGKAVRGIWLAERGKPGNNEMARWYRDFEKNGGKVGWVQNYDGIEDLSKKLAGEMKLYEPGNRARKITRAVLDFIDAGNVAIENALRLATYKAMVEKGIDRAKAAGIASNLTVDFTRKGKLSPQINALYMFFNASVQGSYRMAKALATSPRARKIAGGIAASGFLLQMLALAGGGDDDSDEPYVLGLPDSTRERYILIPMPGQDGRFFKFPKAYGYGALYDLGAEVANSMYMGMTGRQYNHAQGAMRVVSSFANSFNPIQSATILQTIAPTLVDPFVYVGENTNWTGLPLRPAQNNFGPKKPESGRAWKNTNPIYKSIAEGVNSLTGGDRYESGLVDISPEVFEMAVNTALGGLGRFIGNTAALPLATAKGELDAEKIPFVRQVYAKWDDRALSNRYYEAMERAQIARMRFKNAETLAEKRSIFDSPEYKIWRQSNATDKQVKRLRARLNRMEAAGNTVGADYLRKQIVGLQSKVLSTIM